ncbi:MAG: hypothetical protein IT385_28625 [Deltaproteobacteria bacterium]|nr:hypothetical protein [Deltaproteobacteria bacterium]
MTTYVIEPRDTLVLGDGRAIGENAAARSLEVPWPSTVAGALRSHGGRSARDGRFDCARSDEVKTWSVRGPVLATLGEDGEPVEWLAPAPRDAHFVETPDEEVTLRVLAPLDDSDDLSDLPTSLRRVGLAGPPEPRKPWAGAPRYWRWPDFEAWLVAPRDQTFDVTRKNWRPERERRISVSLSPQTRTVKEHVLFEVEHTIFRTGLDRGVGVVAEVDGPAFDQGSLVLGGERRVSFVRPTRCALPTPPPSLARAIAATRMARLVLVTPGIFDLGFMPSAIEGATIIAAAVDRPLVVSGWDWATKTPKAARRCAAPGSVYWVRLDAGTDVDTWLAKRWLRSISTTEQDQRDGFGLAVVGGVA